MKPWKALLPGLALLLAALAVRLPALTAGLPYMSYVDEGHVLHHVSYLLDRRTWEPDTYSYPTLPFYLVAGAAQAWSPVYAITHGHALRDDLSPAPPQHYDLLEPPDLIVIGRLVTLAFSLGIVLLTGLLVRRLAGPQAGLLAAWLAALVPALVARSAIVNVNPMAAFFSLAALLFAERTRTGERPRRDAILAGLMAGLAGVSKYPAALVCLPVALSALLAPAAWPERLRRLALAGGAAIMAALIAMPALALRTAAVLHGLRTMDLVYGIQEMGSYWDQAVRRAEPSLPLGHPEIGIVLLVLAAAGVLVGLRDRRWSGAVAGWLLFGIATGLLVAPYKFRAFRNLLPLVPLACALAALLYAWARERTASRRGRIALGLAAFALPLLLFAPTLWEYGRLQSSLEDSREEAVRWLAGQVKPADRVLVSEELVMLPSRLATLPAETRVLPWPKMRDRAVGRRDQYLVLADLVRPNGRPRIPPGLYAWILVNYEVAARFGENPTSRENGWFHGNRRAVVILKRVPRALRAPAAQSPALSRHPLAPPPPPPPHGAARGPAAR
jgi:hypothetical protein